MLIQDLHSNMKAVLALLPGLSAMLGSRYEIILHDLKHVESSIVGLKGDITHRKLGGPVTDYVLEVLRKYGDTAPDCINYGGTSKDGRPLRSSTIFIRDEAGHIIGCLCINQDLTDYRTCMHLLEDMSIVRTKSNQLSKPADGEHFTKDISELMETMIADELSKTDYPVSLMQKEDKLAVVGRLEIKGIFQIKGSVEYVADCLDVSTFTVYNYLKEIRAHSSREK